MKVISFGGHDINDGENFSSSLTAGGQTPAEMEPQIVGRTGGPPTIGGVVTPARFLVLETTLRVQESAYSKRELQQLWYAWFVTDVTQSLIIADDDGGNQRYVEAMPFSVIHSEDGDGFEILTTLAVDGDVLWRSVALTSESWNVTASGATVAITNGDPAVNDDAYPVMTVTPRQYASGINPYRLFAAVGWRGQAGSGYSTDIVNDSLDTRVASTDFADAAGDDIRVYVDGVEADYWLDGPNTATTKIFVNLNFQAAQKGTLAGAMGSGALTTVTVNEEISGWPESGLFLIDSEVFAYSGKSNATKTFTGVTRASRGTTAATHDSGDAVVWVQHEIWVEYGDAGKSAKAVNDDYKPIFTLASSNNGSWDYDEFYEANAVGYYAPSLRGGAWLPSASNISLPYGGNQGASADPYVEIGMQSVVAGTVKTQLVHVWSLFNPCGISAANFQNGQFYHGRTDWWSGLIASIGGSGNAATGTTRYSIPASTNATWNSWSQNVTGLPDGTTQIMLILGGYASGTYPMRLECADVTVTLDSDYTPLVALGAQETTYRLQPVIANTTTGESIEIDAALDVDEAIEIDVANHQITLADGSDAYNLVTTVEGVRRWILRLQAGENTLSYTEAGLVEVDVDIQFRRRFRV
jgi:hypothetical protein